MTKSFLLGLYEWKLINVTAIVVYSDGPVNIKGDGGARVAPEAGLTGIRTRHHQQR